MLGSRFVTDASLEFVARRLRLMGFDVTTISGARLEELLEAGRREARTVLTLSRRQPKRFADVAVLVLPRGDAASAFRAIVTGHQAAGEPFSRCPRCNVALQRRHPFEARGEVPGRVLRAGGPLSYCPSCGKWYWEGSHTARLREWMRSTIGTVADEAQ
jgi:uncharacterized protein with PIN domain